ncbi:MAG: AfsR/SARP family transcriptional regulator [Pseudonocardiaceae bacterium]
MTVDSPHPVSEWRLQVLGGFRLSAGNTMVAIPLAGQRLVDMLAVRGPSPRLQVAGLLWPDVPEAQALGCLRTSIWRLRRLRLDVAARPRPELALPPGVAVDVHDPATVVASWRNGSRHSSELLPGWYDDWVLLERERIRQVLLHATERAVEDSLARGEPGIALSWAWRHRRCLSHLPGPRSPVTGTERSSDTQRARLAVMPSHPAPTGVCIVRVESHGQGLRLTVTVNPDIAQRPNERPYNFTEVSDALAAVENFLIEYARQQH